MDPITAVGFAASILNFIDFSWNLVSGTYEVYKSTTGTTSDNAHISTVLDDLEATTEGLAYDVEGKTNHEKKLCKLADGCYELSQDLAKILRKLQVSEKDSKWQSLKVKWASMRKEKTVASIEIRLDRYRSQILVRLNFMLSEQQSSIKVQLDKIQKEGMDMSTESTNQFISLRKGLEQMMRELLRVSNTENVGAKPNDESKQDDSLTEIRLSLSKLQSMIKLVSRENRILSRLRFQSMYTRQDTIEEAESGTFEWILENGDDESTHSVDTSCYIIKNATSEGSSENHEGEYITAVEESGSLLDIHADGDDKPLDQGGDSELLLRENITKDGADRSTIPSIADSADTTGSLDSPSSDRASFANDLNHVEISQDERDLRQNTRDSFLTWLRSDSQIYHISGKAGSGKSTLMKFLCNNPRVKQELDNWAGKKKLIFAPFFFWNSGEKLQMSLQGLFRSLLFETLKQGPALIPEIFPSEWEALEFELSESESVPFRIPEINAAFKILIGKQTFSDHRLCFFIDGLDEYEGDSVEHWALAKNLQDWAESKDIKICVSSRPHTQFLKTFSNDPKLRIHLHELTRGDIARFARLAFEKDTNFDGIRNRYESLVNDVVNMADGVFLWARLVVRSLLSGIGYQDSPSVLKEKLNVVPKGLDDLFDKLLDSIDPSDRKRSDRMLLIATMQHTNGLSINALLYTWLEDLADPDFPFKSALQGFSDEEIRTRHESLRCQLDSLSKGLLEMIPVSPRYPEDIFFGYKVQFFHRTVRDYLQENSRQHQMKARLPDFDPARAYCRLCLAKLKCARISEYYLGSPNNYLYEFFKDCMEFISDMATSGHELPFNVVDEFGRVLDNYRRLPVSHGGEDGQIPQVMWSLGINPSDNLRFLSYNDVSYLHWALYFDQLQYVSHEILRHRRDRALANGIDELSLLLTGIMTHKHGHKYVQVLLQAGESYNDQVKLFPGRGKTNLHAKEATVWMIFLVNFGSSAISNKGFLNFKASSLILEQFLKFGADSEISFVLGPAGRSEPTSDELFCLPLQQLLRLKPPSNFDSIQKLLDRKEGSQFWNKATSYMATITPWIGYSKPATSKYKPFEFDELGINRYKLHSVCSKTSQLRSNFSVRLW